MSLEAGIDGCVDGLSRDEKFRKSLKLGGRFLMYGLTAGSATSQILIKHSQNSAKSDARPVLEHQNIRSAQALIAGESAAVLKFGTSQIFSRERTSSSSTTQHSSTGPVSSPSITNVLNSSTTSKQLQNRLKMPPKAAQKVNLLISRSSASKTDHF